MIDEDENLYNEKYNICWALFWALSIAIVGKAVIVGTISGIVIYGINRLYWKD